ncbi:hypothetical protein CKAN_01225800 [Cinnamomum micranthum f. kanehirae]|uniref:Uncharacterized protein n=1 Tax=Cinnamomum micranthum f. kanehirae TaxID=337451 RepID=A0A443NYF1_9MAGN|nr:hypothetical protein CKAN_01225800 [Cinnamomum micranthum f. kanehirae]
MEQMKPHGEQEHRLFHLQLQQQRGPLSQCLYNIFSATSSLWAIDNGPIKMLHIKYQEKIGNNNMEHYIGQLVQLTAYS